MGLIKLTPEGLVHCMLLGLYWEHWPPKMIRRKYVEFPMNGFTTVDHVLKTLLSLGHLTNVQVEAVHNKRHGLLHQRKLVHHCAHYHGEQLMSDKWSYFVIQGKSDQKHDLKRLVLDKRLEILPAGVEVAKVQEALFENTYGLTKRAYLEECERVAALFKHKGASAAASQYHRRRVEESLSEE